WIDGQNVSPSRQPEQKPRGSWLPALSVSTGWAPGTRGPVFQTYVPGSSSSAHCDSDGTMNIMEFSSCSDAAARYGATKSKVPRLNRLTVDADACGRYTTTVPGVATLGKFSPGPCSQTPLISSYPPQ